MTENPYQVMPPLSEEEFAALKASIRENGVRVAVVKDDEGHTIDGYHREQAWRELKDEGHDVPDYPVEVRSDLETVADKRDLAWKLNMQRRHLSTADKRNLVKAKLIESPQWANSRIAKLLGVDDHTVASARLHLESTSEIPMLNRLEGMDGKLRPRSRERDLVAEFEETQRRAVRRELLNMGGHIDDEDLAQRFSVKPEVVASERYDLATSDRPREIDIGLWAYAGRDDLYRMKKRVTPRTNRQAAEQVIRVVDTAVSDLGRAIQGRQIDAALSPEELVEELVADERRPPLPYLGRNAHEIRNVGQWLIDLADQMEANGW
jgi:ParB-like chromosome segregation protein Spo0J